MWHHYHVFSTCDQHHLGSELKQIFDIMPGASSYQKYSMPQQNKASSSSNAWLATNYCHFKSVALATRSNSLATYTPMKRLLLSFICSEKAFFKVQSYHFFLHRYKRIDPNCLSVQHLHIRGFLVCRKVSDGSANH